MIGLATKKKVSVNKTPRKLGSHLSPPQRQQAGPVRCEAADTLSEESRERSTQKIVARESTSSQCENSSGSHQHIVQSQDEILHS